MKRGLLPTLRGAVVSDGILLKAPSKCRNCYSPGRGPFCGNSVGGSVQRCKFGESFIRDIASGQCSVGLSGAGRFSDGQLVEMSELDGRFHALQTIFREVKKISKDYDAKLSRLRIAVDKISDSVDYSKKSVKLMKISEDSREEIQKLIETLSSDIDAVNDLVNSFDYEGLSFSGFLKDAISDFDRRMDPFRPDGAVFSLENLRRAGEALAALDKGALQTTEQANEVRALQNDVDNILDKVLIFNEWVHDANHYMCRIQRAACSRDDGVVRVDRIHSLDALVDALISLKRDIGEDLLGARSIPGAAEDWRYYEPYRLFHKFRYCYWDEGADFQTDGENRNFKVKYVRGMESLVLNIYSNAVKYLPDEGEYSRTVYTSFRETERGLAISVSSWGPVVEDGERGHLGEVGFRARAARNMCKGRGQGLSRIRKVCERAGYELTIDPAPAKGGGYALFTIGVVIPRESFMP